VVHRGPGVTAISKMISVRPERNLPFVGMLPRGFPWRVVVGTTTLSRLVSICQILSTGRFTHYRSRSQPGRGRKGPWLGLCPCPRKEWGGGGAHGWPRTGQPVAVHTRRAGEFRRRTGSRVCHLIVSMSDRFSTGSVASTYSCLVDVALEVE